MQVNCKYFHDAILSNIMKFYYFFEKHHALYKYYNGSNYGSELYINIVFLFELKIYFCFIRCKYNIT